MEVKPQSVEQFLVEQLEKVAPGKYSFANALQLFKSKLRFPCNHLKGGGRRFESGGKDYNISIFTFPTGVTEVKCLYNCGLKIRTDEPLLVHVYNELYDLPSSNSKASAEVIKHTKNGKVIPVDPGPTPVYTDEYRKRIRESNDRFLDYLDRSRLRGRIKPDEKILGGTFPHPDPVEAPDSIIKRTVLQAFKKAKRNPPIRKS